MQAILERIEAIRSDLNRLISEQNIARCRKLLDASRDGKQRQRLMLLERLSDEVAELRRLS